MTFTEEKRQEIRRLFIQFGQARIGRAYDYLTEFSEQDKNALTKFSIIKDCKKFLTVTNIITPEGFQDLEDRKGWTAWMVEHVDFLKKMILEKEEKNKNRLAKFFQKLLWKCKKQYLGYLCNFKGKCKDCPESAL